MSEAYKTDGVVTEHGSIWATNLPFETGQRVELVVWPAPSVEISGRPSEEEIARRLAGLDEMHAWFEANRPVGLPVLPEKALGRESIYDDQGL
jgi:hypothetical protein